MTRPPEIPVGGSTGLDHERRPLDEAAQWLAANGPGQTSVNECKQRFGLQASELGEVCAQANGLRRGQS